MTKISIIIPVYYNQDNLMPLYEDLKTKFILKTKDDYELVFINDGSKDNSYNVLNKLTQIDSHIKVYNLSRNFGSHAAILCGLTYATGDCIIVKAADLQEPTELLLEMIEHWKNGNNVVLAVRQSREDKWSETIFSNMYYLLIRKIALSSMPKGGFDVYLLDRKVSEVLQRLDEKDSALTGQILWSGFRTDIVYYNRISRKIGKSRWTLKKKIRLVNDTIFSFSTLPITFVSIIGLLSTACAVIWAIIAVILKLQGKITVSGWTSLIIFNIFSFGIIMLTLGILGGYLWRTFNAARKRPPYIVEDVIIKEDT